jgi:Leucine-rich repeat (LRR) protein
MLDLEYLLPLKNQLKYIDLTKSLVSNIHLISEFKNLEVVYLGGTSTTDFTWFVGMSNLKGLSVKRNKLSNYEALNQLNKLQKLFVSKSSINSLPIDMLKKKDTEVVIID